jgi:hypothetical protein
MITRSIRHYAPLVAAGAGLCLLGLTACSSSSSTPAAAAAAAAAGSDPSAAAGTTSAAAGGSAGSTVDGCTLVTVAQLNQAVGVTYTALTSPGGGTLCGVKGPGAASFDYTVQKESAINTWSEQVATIKGDDGQAVSTPGIGDRAVWGGKEFAAEADGYIVGVIGADFPSTPQGSGYVRTEKIAKLLISKL